ncbi:glycosyltransferase family 2 protein [candidate division TA06 bacterium]|nr:glycosyltransferase family 2 protein [candidate division TA06 bacterium]
MNSLSVVVLTHNEEKNIEECLRSVEWADEIIIVDSNSTDGTTEVARRWTEKIYQRKWEGFGPLKNFGIEKAMGDWILSLDADERVTEELKREIQEVLQNKNPIQGYYLPRRAFFLGRPIRAGGWYPGYVLRLFQREKGRFNHSLVHEALQVKGKVGYLKEELLHYTDTDLHHYLEKLQQYTSLAAEELYERGVRSNLPRLLLRPPYFFFRMFIIRRGFLDGFHGFILAVLSAFYVFVKYAKLWEKERNQKSNV